MTDCKKAEYLIDYGEDVYKFILPEDVKFIASGLDEKEELFVICDWKYEEKIYPIMINDKPILRAVK